MSEKSQLILMAKYNKLMNKRIFEAAKMLSYSKLMENKNAFFKSIMGTLNHIMIGDILWLKRFSAHPSEYAVLKKMEGFVKPNKLDQELFSDINIFYAQRIKLDEFIIELCNELKEADINNALRYVNFKEETHAKRFGDLILHVFLHQIHHRGQVTTLLSQENINFGDTDLPEIIPDQN
ncbi:MAG: DinB family protein [Pseudomonadota bacterium]